MELEIDNFGKWMYLNCPKEIRKEKHSVVVKFLFKLYRKEIKSLGIRGLTNKELLKEIFLRKELHKPIKVEVKIIQETLPNFNKQRKKILKQSKRNIDTDSFYLTDEWLAVKRKIHRLYKCGCMRCNIEDVETHIDHILPRSKYPTLSFDIHNLQILCRKCNMEKSNIDFTDYRSEEQKKLCSIKYA